MKKTLCSVVKPLEQGERIETRVAQAQYQSCNEQAVGILLTSLDNNHVHFIDFCTTAVEAWNILEKNFGAKEKCSKISLKMDLYSLTMEPNEDIPCLVNRLKSICTQLTYIKCIVDQDDQVVVLLKALRNDMYGQIVTILKEKYPIPSLKDVINSLQAYKKKLKGNASGSNTNGSYLITQNR